MPTVGNSVKFKFGSQQEFDAIVNKDGDTLYFTTDTLILYQGNQRYSKRTKYGTSSPDGSVEGVEGDLYIQVGGDVATGVPFWYYNGTSWAELFHAQLNLEFTPPKTVNGVGDGGDVKTKVVVSISNSKVSSHSHVQILDYFNAGNEVIALYSGMYYPLSSVNTQSGASFERSTVKNGQIVHRSIRIQGTAATIDETENHVDDALSDTSTNPVQNKIVKKYIDDHTVVDPSLSDTSTNPVQNKVVKAELDKKFDKTGGTISGNVYISSDVDFLDIRSHEIVFEAPSNMNGVYFCRENRSDRSKPVITFYGRKGDEAVTLANIEDPTRDLDAANKQYVDNAVAGAGMTHPIVLQKDTDYGDTLPTNPVDGQLFLQNATSGLPIAQGGTGATTQSDALSNLKALPLAGGTMDADSKITHPGNSSSWVLGRDNAILRRPNSPNTTGSYYPIISSKTVNGDWTIGTNSDLLYFNYTTDIIYNSGTNNNTCQFMFGNDGNFYFSGGVKLIANGTLGASASATISGNFDGRIYKNILILVISYVNSGNLYTSYVIPPISDTWKLFLPTYNDYYRLTATVSGSGNSKSCTVQMDSNQSGAICYIYGTM